MQSLEAAHSSRPRPNSKGCPFGKRLMRFLPVYGLVILTVFLIGLFSVLLPNTFPTMLNLRSIVSDKAIIALLSLGAMIPMAAGRIDLTVGYGIVLWHILAISMQTMLGLPWPDGCGDCAAFGRVHRVPEWVAGRGCQDRQLHRDARHRHSPLCPGALAHRRAADGRAVAGRVSTP